MSPLLRFCLLVGLACLSACSDKTQPVEMTWQDTDSKDAGADAGDAESDVGADAGSDAGADASSPDFACEATDECVIRDIASVSTKSCVLRGKAELWCWGESAAAPAQNRVRAKGVRGLAGSASAGMAMVTTEGALWLEENRRLTPMGALNEFEQMAPSARHSCGILTGGRATCFSTSNGGIPLESAGYTPPPGSEDLFAIEIAANAARACLIDQEHRLFCWNRRASGPAIVDADAAVQEDPLTWARPIDPEVRYLKVALATVGMAAITEQGELRLFNTFPTAPDEVVPGPSATYAGPFSSVVVGARHACALSQDGRAFCWGDNSYGQLGRQEVAGESDPKEVITDLRFSRLSVGARHSCGVTLSDEVFCWGDNSVSQLGFSPERVVLTPTSVAPEHRFKELSHSETAACAIRNDGALYCWGASSAALPLGVQEGGTAGMLGADTDWTRVWLGSDRGCGLRNGNKLYCWGVNADSVLGETSSSWRSGLRAVFADLSFQELGLTYNTFCGLDATGVLRCTGANSFGVLGGTTPSASSQPLVVHAAKRFKSVLLEPQASYAIEDSGSLLKWSSLYFAGYKEESLGTGFSLLSSGAPSNHRCAITSLGKVRCWGENDAGQVGVGGVDPVLTPTLVELAGSFTQVVHNAVTSCAVRTDGALYCWGDLKFVKTADATPNSPPTAVLPELRFSKVSLSQDSICGLSREGELLCWGYNGSHILGAYPTSSVAPVKVELP